MSETQSTISWQEFSSRHEREQRESLALNTRKSWNTALGHYTRIIHPLTLEDLNPSNLSLFSAALRSEGKYKPTTIQVYLDKLDAARRWANSIGLAVMPHIARKRVKSHKRSRPLTQEEFQALLGVAPNASWLHLLLGLWLSGLRISEAVALTWNTGEGFSIDCTLKYPRFHIAEGYDKNGNERFAPMTPDFAKFLGDPKSGKVFQVEGTAKELSNAIRELGRKAGIITERIPKIRYATAHDFRRSFGTRWAIKVRPLVLKELMRHSSIRVTEQYYLTLGTDDIWTACGGS